MRIEFQLEVEEREQLKSTTPYRRWGNPSEEVYRGSRWIYKDNGVPEERKLPFLKKWLFKRAFKY